MTTTTTTSRKDKEETLLSEKALRLSWSPPRVPPIGTAHRRVLVGDDPLNAPYAEPHHPESAVMTTVATGYGPRENILQLLYQTPRWRRQQRTHTHPHILVGGAERGDHATRVLSTVLPVSWQNRVRDTGVFRTVADRLVELSIPMGAVIHPRAAVRFLQLTGQNHRIRYGTQHPAQFINLYLPHGVDRKHWTGMLLFVHGGAWGSGKPWYYRLVAQPFLELHMVVAMVGYRVYPDGDTSTQIQDLEAAQSRLADEYPDICGPNREERPIGFCVMGHSSGAHIALLMLVDQAKRLIEAELRQRRAGTSQHESKQVLPPRRRKMALSDLFVGLSGPYDISHHFDYEASRGVEELSPMKASNGYSREGFRENSPGHRLNDFLTTFSESDFPNLLGANDFFPGLLFIHGMEDDTVPFTTTGETAKIFRSAGVHDCQECYVPRTGHSDTVMHLMLGGRVQTFLRTWLQDRQRRQQMLQSKL